MTVKRISMFSPSTFDICAVASEDFPSEGAGTAAPQIQGSTFAYLILNEGNCRFYRNGAWGRAIPAPQM